MGKCNIDGFTCSFAHGFDNSFVKSLIKIGFIEVLLYPSSVLGRSPLQSESKNNLMSLHSTIVTLAGHLMQSYFSSKSTNCHHMSCFLEAAMGPTVLSLLYDRHSVKFVIRIFRMPWKRKLMWDRIGNLFSPFEFHVKWWNGKLKSLFLVKQQSDSQSETNFTCSKKINRFQMTVLRKSTHFNQF